MNYHIVLVYYIHVTFHSFKMLRPILISTTRLKFNLIYGQPRLIVAETSASRQIILVLRVLQEPSSL